MKPLSACWIEYAKDHAVASARRVAGEVTHGEMSVVQGDFYEVELDGTFDVVCYFDGFGIGSDADQRRLLRRRPEPQSPGLAYLEAGVIGRLEGCEGNWCRVQAQGFEGWLRQGEVFGIGPAD